MCGRVEKDTGGRGGCEEDADYCRSGVLNKASTQVIANGPSIVRVETGKNKIGLDLGERLQLRKNVNRQVIDGTTLKRTSWGGKAIRRNDMVKLEATAILRSKSTAAGVRCFANH